jgi:hypothetical protein
MEFGPSSPTPKSAESDRPGQLPTIRTIIPIPLHRLSVTFLSDPDLAGLNVRLDPSSDWNTIALAVMN